jgi:hypothetical protein
MGDSVLVIYILIIGDRYTPHLGANDAITLRSVWVWVRMWWWVWLGRGLRGGGVQRRDVHCREPNLQVLICLFIYLTHTHTHKQTYTQLMKKGEEKEKIRKRKRARRVRTWC